MDKRQVFNEIAYNYNFWRPGYSDDLFSDIVQYSRIDNNKLALEVGCGTGQATDPILRTGCQLIAVECGENLASFVGEKFKHYSNFHIVNTEFEKYSIDDDSVDLLYSASAFHWIVPDIGYKKAYSILKHGGTIALFWNSPFVNREDDPLHQKIQTLYRQFRPLDKPRPEVEKDKERYYAKVHALNKYGFTDFKYSIYKRTRAFNADDYISLLNTYSDHRMLPYKNKIALESGIKAAIEDNGGILKIYDTMDLYLARKPY